MEGPREVESWTLFLERWGDGSFLSYSSDASGSLPDVEYLGADTPDILVEEPSNFLISEEFVCLWEGGFLKEVVLFKDYGNAP